MLKLETFIEITMLSVPVLSVLVKVFVVMLFRCLVSNLLDYTSHMLIFPFNYMFLIIR